MNEFLFFADLVVIFSFALIALKLGKEALIVWVVLQALLANLFVTKQMLFFGLEITCSDVFSVGSLIGLNLLQEHFGKALSKKTIWLCFYFLLFFALVAKIHLLYVPSLHDATHPSFLAILSPAPRLLIASLFSFLIAQQIDVVLLSWMKRRFTNSSMTARTLIAMLIAQFFDTLLFSFLGLYGLAASLADIILFGFLIKCTVILCYAPFSLIAKRLVHSSNRPLA